MWGAMWGAGFACGKSLAHALGSSPDDRPQEGNLRCPRAWESHPPWLWQEQRVPEFGHLSSHHMHVRVLWTGVHCKSPVWQGPHGRVYTASRPHAIDRMDGCALQVACMAWTAWMGVHCKSPACHGLHACCLGPSRALQ